MYCEFHNSMNTLCTQQSYENTVQTIVLWTHFAHTSPTNTYCAHSNPVNTYCAHINTMNTETKDTDAAWTQRSLSETLEEELPGLDLTCLFKFQMTTAPFVAAEARMFSETYCQITYRGFPTRMVYLHSIPCLRYSILVGKPQYIIILIFIITTTKWQGYQ